MAVKKVNLSRKGLSRKFKGEGKVKMKFSV